ncbi:hypothetical protein ACHHYP_20011 [Achlya hypogyna]|uniref:Uncharacterized protein n=1 Tax=Achlya hypogyna TaxID=1202772 RepID=A0A1V9ZB18_ACHHY|nr:hypothetical protein ACHHYP_20011 [Achlya hypogyna]
MPLTTAAQCIIHTVCPVALTSLAIAGVSANLQTLTEKSTKPVDQHLREHTHHTTWRGCR